MEIPLIRALWSTHRSSLKCGHNAIAKSFTWDELEQAIGRRGDTTVSLTFEM